MIGRDAGAAKNFSKYRAAAGVLDSVLTPTTNWTAGNGPTNSTPLIRHSNVVSETFLELAGREPILAGNALIDARNILADMLGQIDSWMNGAARCGDDAAADFTCLAP